jgi:hypothetical protein
VAVVADLQVEDISRIFVEVWFGDFSGFQRTRLSSVLVILY